MRIAYFTTAFALGGAEMQVYLTAREMRRRGADVIVVRLKDSPSGLLHKLLESDIPTGFASSKSSLDDFQRSSSGQEIASAVASARCT